VAWQFIGHIVRITGARASCYLVGGGNNPDSSARTRSLAHAVHFAFNVRIACKRLGAAALRLTLSAGTLCLTFSACTLARPNYAAPDVAVGESAFVRTLEAHADAELVHGNRAQILLNGDEIFPAMLDAIRQAKMTITFANFIYEQGDVASEMADALAERCRAGVGVNVLVDFVGSKNMPKNLKRRMTSSGCPGAPRTGHRRGAVDQELADRRCRRSVPPVHARHRGRAFLDPADDALLRAGR
jgi:hypothetical protein